MVMKVMMMMMMSLTNFFFFMGDVTKKPYTSLISRFIKDLTIV